MTTTDVARKDEFAAAERGNVFSMTMKHLPWVFAPLITFLGIGVVFLDKLSEILHVENDVTARYLVAAAAITLSLAILTIAKSHSEIEKKLTALAELPSLAKSQAEMDDKLKALAALPDLAMRYAEMQEKLAALKEMAGSLERQEKRLETANLESNTLRSLVRIYHRTPPHRIHLRAGINVLQNMHALNFETNFSSIEKLSHERAPRMSLEDRSLAFMYLREILGLLPAGGVWFGVTHLTSRKVWARGVESGDFALYRRNMWARASAGELSVFRIYSFPSTQDFQQMRDTLKEEHQHGVVVKYIVGGGGTHGSHSLPDMSLLWMPQPSAPPRARVEAGEINNQLEVETMKNKGYLPACGIRFEVESHEQLSNVDVYDPDTDDFRTLLHKFVTAWAKEAKPWP